MITPAQIARRLAKIQSRDAYYTAEKLALAAHVSRRALSYLINGHTARPHESTLTLIADELAAQEKRLGIRPER